VVNEDDVAGAEQALADCQRPDLVVGDLTGPSFFALRFGS
jgi:hypothetical protein